MFLGGDSPRKAANFGIPKRGDFGIPKWDFFFLPTRPPLSAAIGRRNGIRRRPVQTSRCLRRQPLESTAA
uniref:Uncharacterized protein n=1 Tax=Rhizobium leguminosarum TaxID=384 RepID=A0A154IL72_RHILE|nr:hypothetical protein A4A59_14070 [Rhizobium leguminosarum]